MGPYAGVRSAVLAWLCMLAFASASFGAESLVHNGSFEKLADGNQPDGWITAGRSDIKQDVFCVEDAKRGRVARLRCTHFEGGSPDAHVMLAQVGQVGVKKSKWYRLSLWARSEDLEAHAVDVGLSNTRNWSRTGLSETFAPSPEWQRFEFLFQATQNLEPTDSRLQIWFKSTGTLWMDDVKLVELDRFTRTWHPSVSLKHVPNAIPNSSFECGGEGWGSWSPGIPGWGAHVFRRMGEWEDKTSYHGDHCWKVSLDPDDLPVAYFDYYEPVEEPLKALLIGHEHWVEVESGGRYVFSAYVRADRNDLPVRISIWEGNGRRHERTFSTGTAWKRIELSFKPRGEFACGFVGLDVRNRKSPRGTLWIDAVQFETGRAASTYQPRGDLETNVFTDRVGNIFTRPAEGLHFALRVFNAGKNADILSGELTLTDYRDRAVWENKVRKRVAARSSAIVSYEGLVAGKRGFYRLRWEPEDGPAQELRCALIEPYQQRDSVFGMNHAFSWDFLLNLAHKAGVRWWRDWSVKWDTVQPEADGLDFTVPDAQIDRVLDAGGNVLVLLPFPSAQWSSSADMEKVKEEAGNNRYLRHRLQVAWKPKKLEPWADYVRATVNHYKDRIDCFEVLNEPLFTTYSVPARFGHSVSDYLDLLRVAQESARDAAPDCTVIGGTSSPPTVHWLTDFIREGGLRWCDVTNYHMYPSAAWPESHESALRDVRKLMHDKGMAKPIWFTEFGLYADDDPPCTPYGAGDATMNRAMRQDELGAAADMVRFTALFCAHGVRKLFYHAGTCSELHRSSAGNVFFEYGGDPRKQYAAQAALSQLLRPDFEFVREWQEYEELVAYEFRSRGRTVVIAWTREAGSVELQVPGDCRALDLMGNPIEGDIIALDNIPVYLVSK